MLSAILLLFRQSWFLCKEFDGTYANLHNWWELGENYEIQTIGLLTIFQIINAAVLELHDIFLLFDLMKVDLILIGFV